MDKDNFIEKAIKENDSTQIFKIIAIVFALIAIYTILDNPNGVIEGFLDSMK